MINQNHNHINQLETGFTLIEVMVTIAIMGIIASIAVPSFTNQLAQKRTQQGALDIVSIFDEARTNAALSNKPATIGMVTGSDNKEFTISFVDRTAGVGTQTVVKRYQLNDSLRVFTDIPTLASTNTRTVIEATTLGGIQTIKYEITGTPPVETATPLASTYHFRVCDKVTGISGYSVSINARGVAKYQAGAQTGDDITSRAC